MFGKPPTADSIRGLLDLEDFLHLMRSQNSEMYRGIWRMRTRDRQFVIFFYNYILVSQMAFSGGVPPGCRYFR